ncbi:hybrid sensor histidine kinase/response regulator [Novosphingobium sp.]|uniref:hybrid sensor histidine kinase/response regulator n=1 Tax=Novosphingobium sp. TaxID=1874826 RepID=UPI002FDE961F
MSTLPAPRPEEEEAATIARLEDEVRKLRKINAALIDRVERSTDLSHSAFSMFERAITLEQLVRDRTRALEDALGQLASANAKLAQARAEAEAAETRLRDAIESINEGFALFDAEDRLVLYNEAYLGFWPDLVDVAQQRPTFHEIITMLAEQRCPAGALSSPDRWVSDRLARHAVAEGGHVQALSDGRWIQINELRTSEGGIVGIYTDITEAKAEDARARARDLAEQNLALQALLDNLVEGVCMFDADRRLTAWNGALQRLLGLSGDASGALSQHADLVRFCRESLAMDGAEVLDWRTEGEAPVRNRLCQVGERIWDVRTTVTALGGMVVGFLDVTEPATARQILQDTAETLERRVAERTTELMALNQRLASEVAERRAIEAQLLEAKTAAELANRSKTSFIAAASHDLLQPLNAARLFIAALTERRLALPTRALVNQASTSLNSVEDLLETIFEISRLDAGAITPVLGNVNLAALLATLQTEFAPMARSAGLAFVVEPVAAWVRSDARLLRRILQNLVSNAIRYTARGEVRITVDQPAPGQVRVSVADTGPGIPHDQQERIFEEFRRLDTSNRIPGKGLGLAIVRRATAMLQHPLALNSEAGAGACFAVTLPEGECQADAVPAHAKPARDRTIQGRRILVIDNEAQIQLGMETLLSGWGCQVTAAGSGAAALDRLGPVDQGALPDVIIADFHLDHAETGDQAVHDIRTALGRDLPAIIISADRSEELKTRLAGQKLPLLGKPVKPAQLRALLQTMMN